MTYQVMARKWRPQTFEEVIAQEHVTKTLQNAIGSGRIGHAYLFSGPRGVGKTTVARILAKALNCEQGPTPTPCNDCTLCREITEDRSLDVLEIDGASNRQVADAEELRGNVKYTPTHGRYKIYIIDEIHMLSKHAFNALLKTLEEPPAHVIFIFATTEPQKIPLTIQSRCQRFDFRRIPTRHIKERLHKIAEQEDLQAEASALSLLARRAEGSMRDGLSLLDQAVSFGGEKITERSVAEALGLASQEIFFQLLDAARAGDSKEALRIMAAVEEHGWDMEDFADGLQEHLRHLLVAAVDPQSPELEGLSQTDRERFGQQSGDLEEEDLLRMISLTSAAQSQLRFSNRPRFLLETLAVKLAKMDRTVRLQDLLAGLDRYAGNGPARTSSGRERSAAGNKPGPPPSPAPRRPAASSPGPDLPTPPAESTSSSPAPSPSAEGAVPPAPSPSAEPAILPATSSTEESRLPPAAKSDPGDLWHQVVDRVTRKRSGLGALLQHSQLDEVEEKTLTIAFPTSCNFHRERAQMRSNREVIEKEVSALLGKDIRVRFTLADHVPLDTSPIDRTAPGRVPPSPEKIIKNEPIIGDILETLDGEIIT
jgi:DNA polymerase-3 subunit gamma/tau